MPLLTFSKYAADYDTDFTNTHIGRLQRQRVWKHLAPMLQKNMRVLEINCGTGHDAIQISHYVRSVMATDIAPGMIDVAEEKRNRAGARNLKFFPADIRTLPHQLSTEYSLLFSNFGGLNCISRRELKRFSRYIAPSIAENGRLVLVIMGTRCLWEDLLYWWQNDRRLFRRRREKGNGVDTVINSESFKTYYYSPKQIAAIFGADFKVKKVRPVGLFIPPSYMKSFFEGREPWLRFLDGCERVFGRFSFLSNYADHYLIVLEKK